MPNLKIKLFKVGYILTFAFFQTEQLSPGTISSHLELNWWLWTRICLMRMNLKPSCPRVQGKDEVTP